MADGISKERKMSFEKPRRGHRCLVPALLFAALLALPAHADDASATWWDVLVDAVNQIFGDDPEAGLSIEPGG